MRPPEQVNRLVLIPFNRSESFCLKDAAKIAGKKEGTLRLWCIQHGIGRRVGGGAWMVSKVALAMFLDGDLDALAAYHLGDRRSLMVTSYFDRVGVDLQNYQSS